MSSNTYETEAVIHIRNLLEDFGFTGYLKHLGNKLIWAGSDGTFFYGGEGDFHLETQSSSNTIRGILQNYFYIETPYYQHWFSSYWQGIWLFICLRCSISIFFKRQHPTNHITRLSILGLFMFLLLFENRSRYLFLYLPMLLLSAEHSDTDMGSMKTNK